ncbi:MAG: archaemetzincin family Zn-dependent metalloprotease [Bacteroidota bacterium]
MASIMVVPIGDVSAGHLLAVTAGIGESFFLPVVRNMSGSIDPAFAFDPSRNQYYSTLLLSSLVRKFSSHQGKVLAVTEKDLYIPVLTYVFGEAQLDGMAAIISTYRLDDTLYGLPVDPRRFEERMIKEAVHELGHAFGLVHCRDFECVMHSSSGVEEVDLKPASFCVQCTNALQTTAVTQ